MRVSFGMIWHVYSYFEDITDRPTVNSEKTEEDGDVQILMALVHLEQREFLKWDSISLRIQHIQTTRCRSGGKSAPVGKHCYCYHSSTTPLQKSSKSSQDVPNT